MPWYEHSFFQNTLPIMVTFAVAIGAATISQNKRIDDLKDAMNARFGQLEKAMEARFDALEKRLDAIEKRIEKIEDLLKGHDRDIAALKERTGLVKFK